MNALKIHGHFNATPEGFDIGKVSQRTCCQIGMALGAIVPLPGAEVSRTDLRNYYMDNSKVLREVAFDINEVVPFNVDRAVDYGYRVYARRYELAHFCHPHDLLEPMNTADHIPEFEECALDRETLAKTITCLRDGVAEKTGA